MRILILETDNILAANLCKLLRIAGHETDWQVDPQESILSIDNQPVDLVITDLVLAGRSGIEFLYEFRSYPDWVDVPVIIYSSVPAAEVGQSARGFEHIDIRSYLYKPATSPAELVGYINANLVPSRV